MEIPGSAVAHVSEGYDLLLGILSIKHWSVLLLSLHCALHWSETHLTNLYPICFPHFFIGLIVLKERVLMALPNSAKNVSFEIDGNFLLNLSLFHYFLTWIECRLYLLAHPFHNCV